MTMSIEELFYSYIRHTSKGQVDSLINKLISYANYIDSDGCLGLIPSIQYGFSGLKNNCLTLEELFTANPDRLMKDVIVDFGVSGSSKEHQQVTTYELYRFSLTDETLHSISKITGKDATVDLNQSSQSESLAVNIADSFSQTFFTRILKGIFGGN